MPIPSVSSVSGPAEAGFDALVVVVRSPEDCSYPEVAAAASIDAGIGSKVTVMAASGVAGGRLILTPTGPLTRDFDDPRCISDAAKAGVAAAVAAGAKAPLVHVAAAVAGAGGEYSRATLLAATGALEACYSTIQTREARGDATAEPVTSLGFWFDGVAAADADAALAKAVAVEKGRRVARDICSGDPERMAPPAAAEYIQAAFAGLDNITVEVEDDFPAIEAAYPLLAAVSRADRHVARHHPRVVTITYTPTGGFSKHVAIVGKGVTYDTGGADIKAGGIMAGMKRDKGGAAAAAGLLRTAAELQPEGVRLVAILGFVRNSVGSECYVADEVITGHAGKSVLVVNTDAEGRMVMADLLSVAREAAIKAVSSEGVPADGVQLHTCATLTGHAVVAVGPYPIACDNPVAAARGTHGTARAIQAAAHPVGDPFEVSTLRREDFAFVRPKHSSYDVLQCNTLPSSRTPRGHQFPMAFLVASSGLGDHGRDSELPIAYTHLDIAGAASRGDVAAGYETGSPVLGLAAHYLNL